MSSDIDPKLRAELQAELSLLLNIPVKDMVGDVSPEITSKFLCTAIGTLAIWRTTGRYNLPFYKAGRMIRYRMTDLVEFKANRMRCTGGVIGEKRVA